MCPGHAGPGHKGPLANLLRAGFAVFRRSGFGQVARPGLPVMPAFTRQPNDIDGPQPLATDPVAREVAAAISEQLAGHVP